MVLIIGSVHDARIFAECDMARNVTNYLTENEWIAADSAYRLSKQVITPFRKNARQSTSECRKAFNKYFSSFRVRIEHCFGILKERFGSLKEMRIKLHSQDAHKYFCDWILVCCILNNMVMSNEDLRFQMDNVIFADDEHNDDFDNVEDHNIEGEQRRQLIYDTCIANI